jgi:hypothetical protein
MRRTEEQKMGRKIKYSNLLVRESVSLVEQLPKFRNNRSAVIIRTKNCLILKVKALRYVETSGIAGPATQCNAPDVWNFQQHYYLKTPKCQEDVL